MSKLKEGVEHGDLKRLVIPVVEIDSYKSKMGEDADISVLSFTVKSKMPALDLVSFIEKGYTFVLDADCSSGEDDNGNFQVFVELERTPKLPDQIIEIVKDMLNLTEQDADEWKFKYYRYQEANKLSETELRNKLILTPEEYKKTIKQDEDEMNKLKSEAGIKVKSKKNKDKDIQKMQVDAGII